MAQQPISNKILVAFIIAASLFLQRCELDVSRDGLSFKLRPLPLWVLGIGTSAIVGILTLEQKDIAAIVRDASHSAIDKFLGDREQD